MISTFQDATRSPQPAARKGPTVCAFAGSGRRVAPLETWKLFLDNSLSPLWRLPTVY